MLLPTVSSAEAHSLLLSRPTVVELFAGVGGLSLGLEQAGFHVSVAVEVEDIHGRYAQYNFPGTHVLFGKTLGDVCSFSKERFGISTPKIKDEITLVAGGPPCQGFSLAGMKLSEDPLNDLVLEFARVTCELMPLAFLMENVPGITRGNSRHLKEALERLERHYRITEPTSLWACDFGVPQLRERIFVVGIRKDVGIEPSLPSSTHLRPDGKQLLLSLLPTSPTVWEAIADIPEVDNYPELIDGDRISYDKAPTSEYAQIMRGRVRDTDDLSPPMVWHDRLCTNIRRTQHGENLQERFSRLGYNQQDRLSGMRRLDPDGLSTTIRAGTTKDRGAWSAPRPVHPFQNRVLTTRECARLQSFPDWFLLHPAKWHGNRQVGNAVPPLLARAVGKHILALLGIQRPAELLPYFYRDDALVEGDIQDAAASGLSRRRVSQQVIHPRAMIHDISEESKDLNIDGKKRPLEFYGELAIATNTNTTRLREAIAGEHCPFIDARCVKQRKSDSTQTIGTCIAGYQGVPLIICPKRFLQGHQIFLDCIRFLPRNGRYFVVPEVTVPGGNVDYFLVAQDESGDILDYIGIEIQSLDTTATGGLWDARVDAVKDTPKSSYNFGINWKMSAKTILIQMAHKAPTFEALGKKLVLVVQSEFMAYMEREFRSGHLRTADPTDAVHFHSYDCVYLGNALSIVQGIAKSTSAHGVDQMLGSGKENIIAEEVMITALKAKMHRAFELHPAR